LRTFTTLTLVKIRTWVGGFGAPKRNVPRDKHTISETRILRVPPCPLWFMKFVSSAEKLAGRFE
jgi:hypothetical protein